MPALFIVSNMKGSPWVQVQYTGEKWVACGRCGRDVVSRGAPVSARLEKGSVLTDVIGAGTGGVLVSEAVAEYVLSGDEGCGCDAVAVKMLLDGRAREVRPEGATYYEIHPRTAVDVQPYSRLGAMGVCGGCGSLLRAGIPFRYKLLSVPRVVCAAYRLGGYANHMMVCGVGLLKAARKYRWTNFRFVPIEWTSDSADQMLGVDYLGKTWPPVGVDLDREPSAP